MHNIIKPSNQPSYSIVVPFCRMWTLDYFFMNLASMDIPESETELLLYVDTSDTDLENKVIQYANMFKDFNGVKVIFGRNGKYNPSCMETRRRIAQVHTELKEYVQGRYVLGLEDDTLYLPNTFYDLVNFVEDSADIGFCQGVEIGRRDYKVYGSWRIRKQNGGTLVTSDKRHTGITPIHGGGFYCFCSPTHVYKQIDFHKYRGHEYGFMGVDFCYVKQIRDCGYKCYTNWDLACEHLYLDGDEVKSLTVDNAIHIASWFRPKGVTGWEHKLDLMKHVRLL